MFRAHFRENSSCNLLSTTLCKYWKVEAEVLNRNKEEIASHREMFSFPVPCFVKFCQEEIFVNNSDLSRINIVMSRSASVLAPNMHSLTSKIPAITMRNVGTCKRFKRWRLREERFLDSFIMATDPPALTKQISLHDKLQQEIGEILLRATPLEDEHNLRWISSRIVA